MRLKLLELSSALRRCSDWEILNLMFPNNRCDKEITWLLGHYVNFTWKHFLSEQTEIKVDKLFGFLMCRYKVKDSSVGNILGFH